MSSNARALSKLVVGGEVQSGGTEVYATVGDLPLSGNDAGDTAFVTENNRMYIWNGNGWFSVALINTSPTITNAPNSVYNLNADGTPTIITLAATDPEGFPLTWSHTANDAAGKATITNVDNVFTITPLTNIADTSFNIDFNVTDGVNVSTASSTINIENRDPIIDTPSLANYALATDGTPTVITLAATDPDGQAITWTYNATGLTNQATITQSGSEFTITPTTSADEYSDFTIEFVASDSIESASSTSSFSLTFMLLSPLWKDVDLSIGTNSTDGLDNSTFVDRSTNAHTVTPVGTPVQTAFHPYLENWSVDFDGTNDYLTMPDSDAFHIGQSDFTIDFWLNKQTTSSYQHIFRQRVSGTNEWGLVLDYSGTGGDHFEDGALWFEWGSGKFGWDDAGIPNNEWCHVAVTRSGTTATLYVNGVSQGTRTMNDISNLATILYVGGWPGSSLYKLKGYLSNLRIVKGTTLYTGNFTPPTEKLTAVSGTVLLTCQSNRFVDNSSNAHSITVNGDPEVSAFNPFGQGSEYAAGENKGSVFFVPSDNSYIAAPQVPFGTGDFTVEGWHYLFSKADTYPALFSTYNSFTAGGFALFASHNSYAGVYSVAWNGSFPAINAGTVKYNQWVHYAFVRSSGTVTLYIDGESIGSFSGATTIDGVGPNVTIGGTADVATTSQLDGYVSDVNVQAGTARYTANFTPPTAPVGNTNASLYLPFDNAGIFDKTANNILTLVGNTSTSTTQTKFADTAIYFDGTGDYISVPVGTDSITLNDADFTLECWVNFTTVGDATLFGCFNTGGNKGYELVRYNGSLYFQAQSAGILMIVPWTPTSGVWYHLAVTRNGATTRYYVDGVLLGEDPSTSGAIIQDVDFQIGQRPGGAFPFNGYIENLQILKGVAKYTSNFTVPDQEQGRNYQAES